MKRAYLVVQLCVLVACAAHADDAAIVVTQSGPVAGRQIDGTLVFRGIPYAAAPVGRLRFRPPAAPVAWSETRPAMDLTPACPQTDWPQADVMSEDCLTVNVWTPRADRQARPVLVWIHGGAFIVGTARSTWYDSAELARRGDVVVVTLQYRLGALGFLELAESGGDQFIASGNAGLLDQVAALRWVHENIAAFGGDPNNVTVFGESAGGLSVEALIATRSVERDRCASSNGLFHKAIAQSPWLYAQTKARANQIARQFMELAHASTVDQLQSLSSDQVLAAQLEMYRARFSDTAFMPVIDQSVLFDQPVESLRKGLNSTVPLLIGTTLEEIRYWSAFEGLAFAQRPAAQVSRQLSAIAGADSSRLIDAYMAPSRRTRPGVETLLTDAIFRMPAIGFAQANSGRAPTWMYLFTYSSTSTKYSLGVAHAMELPFVFGGLNRPEIIAFTGADERRERLKEQIQDAWIAFARTGDPNHDGLPKWPPYNVKTRPTMELGVSSQLLNDPFEVQRRAWDGVAFDGTNPSLDQLTDLIAPTP